MKPKKHSPFWKLTKDFLSNRLSAAGISNLVNEKSKRKKLLWACLLLVTVTSMSYMTYVVIHEYFTYPKLMIKENVFTPILKFPAVTICPLSTIVPEYVESSTMHKLWKLQQLLQQAPAIAINRTIESSCYHEPLCDWSYFLGRCECSKSPCDLSECTLISQDNCSCPLNLCEVMDDTVCQMTEQEDTDVEDHENAPEDAQCICSRNKTSLPPSNLQNKANKYTKQAIASIKDPEVREVASLIAESQTNDLSDIFMQLVPSLTDIYKYGAEFSRFILSCSFVGRPCDKRNFTVFYHIIYGKCFMFNYVGESEIKPVLTTMSTGSEYGLSLLLDVTPNPKLQLLSPEIGARVTIHDPRQYPFIAEDGFNVADEMSGIEISSTTINRLPEPWGKCAPDKSEFKPYNQLACQKDFLYRNVHELCGCILRHALNGIIYLWDTSEENLVFCNASHVDCTKNVTQEIESNRIPYDCPPPCKELRFWASVTSSSANRKFYEKIRFIKSMKPNRADIGNLSSDLAGIKIYYTTQKEHRHNEIPTYSAGTLLANIGGNLGFFMGLSIVTFFQVTEFMWDVLWTTCASCFRPKHQKSRSTEKVSPAWPQSDKYLHFPYEKYHGRR